MGCAGSSHTGVHSAVLPAKGDTTNTDVGGSSPSRPSKIEAQPAADEQKPFHEQYVLSHKLGKGAFAAVYLAHRVGEDHAVAVKVMDLRANRQDPSFEGGQDLKRVNEAKKEVATLELIGGLKHENVIGFHTSFLEGSLSYIVMERCDSGLLQVLERMPTFNEHTLGNVLLQMLQGIAAVNELKVVHRDLKADNFLCVDLQHPRVKLCDFGLAGTLADGPDGELKGVYGTPPFMAPEMLRGERYGTKVDAWSFGVLAYTLLFGRFPYTPTEQTGPAMKVAILSGLPPPSFQCKTGLHRVEDTVVSSRATSLVRNLLSREPAVRMTTSEALQHEFFTAPPLGELCSLRPMLYSAKRIGAFDVRREKDYKKTDVDDRLMQLQESRHGAESVQKLLNQGSTKGVDKLRK